MNDLERKRLLADYKNGPSELQQALAKLPGPMWRFKPAPNSWSIHEVVVHLADAEVQSHVRFRTVLAEPATLIPAHDEYQWSQALDYASQSVQVSLRIIALMRESNHSLLTSIPEGLWFNSCQHSVRGPETLDTMVRGYTEHVRQHMAQMKRCHEAWQALATSSLKDSE